MADKEFPQKYIKRLPPEFIENIASMSEEEIKQRILTCEGSLYEIEAAKDQDEKLQQAKEMIKEMSAPYRENKAIETAKIQYCIYTLESRGVNL